MFRVTSHENKSIGWWFTHQNDIDMDPFFQRKGNLWTREMKQYLLDSILNEFDIPKIYLADFTLVQSALNEKNKMYAIIDGRQRFEAIFEFMRNTLPLSDDFKLFKQPVLPLAGLTYKDLVTNYPSVADIFREFNLHVMSIVTDSEGMINDLFVRLNSSRPLTGAEIRNAMEGVVPTLIRTLSDHTFFKHFVKFSTNRAQDKNAVAKLMLLEFRGSFVDTKKIDLDRFVREGQMMEKSDIERTASRVDQILTDLCKVFTPADSLLSSEGVLPLYYWMIREFGARADLRAYFVLFTANRKSNKHIAQLDSSQADSELLQFDVMSRSVNDAMSLSRQYEILRKRYLTFTPIDI